MGAALAEQVALGDVVRDAVPGGRVDVAGVVVAGDDAQDLAAQVVGVGRGLLRVVVGPPGPLVVGGVAVVVGGRGVVARREVQHATVAELHRAGGVAADVALRADLEDDLLRRLVDERLAVRVGLHGEAGQPVGVVRGGQRRVVDVDPAVVGEVGVDGDAEATVLEAAPHPEAGVVHDDLDAAVGGVVHRDVAGAGDEEDPPVRGDRQLHDLAEAGALAEDDLLELRQVRRVVRGGRGRRAGGGGPARPVALPGPVARGGGCLRLGVTGRDPVRQGVRHGSRHGAVSPRASARPVTRASNETRS